MNHRLAFLSAILAAPDDDLPRLVFADWLEENGTTDADAARVEFIRLGCKGKAKSRISTAEGKWLDANWRRLLGQTIVALHPNSAAEPPVVRRDGKHLCLRFRWYDPSRIRAGELTFEYVRGFARRVEFRHGLAYQQFWQKVVADEPLAYLRPGVLTDQHHRIDGWLSYVTLHSERWGKEVYSRAVGFDEQNSHFKVFRARPTPEALRAQFHPLVLRDLGELYDPLRRELVAVATAMTAIAREFVGLDPSL